MQKKLLSIFKYQNSRIAKYIRHNLVTLFFAIIFIIGLVVFGNQFVLMVQESVERGIPLQELMPLVSFNMIRDVSLILSLSLFLAIILTISQLYKNSEAVVMNSLGLSDKHFIVFIQPLVLLSFVIIFFLTIYAVPWAMQQKNIMEEETKNASEFSFITEGEFEVFKQGKIVFYASESKPLDTIEGQNMEEIFIYAFDNEKPVIVLASEAKKYIDSESKSIYLRLKDGVRYQGIPGNENINILNFDWYDLEIVSGELQKSIVIYTKIEGKSTLDLIKEGGRYANAELQWRLSQPITVLILSVIGVFLGKTSPRGGKGVNLLIGIIVFMLYYNGLLIAKSAIELGQMDPIIGLWGVHLLMVLLLLLLYQFRQMRIANYLDKIPFFNNKDKSHA
ncbi:MAG: LPS export ABC transporter permease LptF [Candidatus Thioglobus autotrophicus]|nr:LPS export ABC transporter permease LptF [Candidatus Thioglobus autotrophicus]